MKPAAAVNLKDTPVAKPKFDKSVPAKVLTPQKVILISKMLDTGNRARAKCQNSSISS